MGLFRKRGDAGAGASASDSGWASAASSGSGGQGFGRRPLLGRRLGGLYVDRSGGGGGGNALRGRGLGRALQSVAAVVGRLGRRRPSGRRYGGDGIRAAAAAKGAAAGGGGEAEKGDAPAGSGSGLAVGMVGGFGRATSVVALTGELTHCVAITVNITCSVIIKPLSPTLPLATAKDAGYVDAEKGREETEEEMVLAAEAALAEAEAAASAAADVLLKGQQRKAALKWLMSYVEGLAAAVLEVPAPSHYRHHHHHHHHHRRRRRRRHLHHYISCTPVTCGPRAIGGPGHYSSPLSSSSSRASS